MSIFKHIVDLLYNNDCVILPGFGAFVLKNKSAFRKGDEFFPPSKYVSFNSMLKENDVLLLKYISNKNNITYKKALDLVNEEVDLLNENLSKNLVFEIDSLGIFELKENEVLIFNPDFSVNYNSLTFGFKSFTRKPIHRTIKKEFIKDIPSSPKLPLLRYAATALILIGLGYFGYFNYNSYLDNEKLKNIAIAQDKILENVQTATFNLGELPAIRLNVTAPIVNEKSIYFSVISGSFRSKVNAEKQLNYLISLGYKASYTSINPKGLYRVAYGRLETRNEAANLMSSIKNNGQDAWLLIEN